MRSQVISCQGKYKWTLARGALYDGRQLELNWLKFLPDGVGTKYNRARLVAGAKEFLLVRLERPVRKWRSDISAVTFAGWFTQLRGFVRWMVANNIWQFGELAPDHVISFLKSRKARHGNAPPSRVWIEGYMSLFDDMWAHRHAYVGPIRFNPRESEDEVWVECRVREGKPWRAIEELAALALLVDSLQWIRTHGEFFVDASRRIFEVQSKWVGLSRYQQKRLSTALFASICADPRFEEISAKCGASKTGAGLAHAFTCTTGAAINVLLFTIGQRVSELMRLDTGCLLRETTANGVPISYIKGIAAKKSGLERMWVAGDPVPEVIEWLEDLYAPARAESGLGALFVKRTSGSAIPLPGRKLGRMSVASPVTAMRAFARAPFRSARPEIKGLHPHAARKTFAAFVVSRDKTALEALSLHFGHAYRAFTDGAYAGNLELQQLLSEADRRELGRALSDLLSSSRLAGRAAESVRQFKRSPIRFRGKLFLQRTVDDLIARGVRLAPCNWGYCLYSQSLSACGGDEGGPNDLRRSPEVCAGCANFVVSDAHAAWWNARVKSDEDFLKHPGLPEQTRVLVLGRLDKSRQVLRDLISTAKQRGA